MAKNGKFLTFLFVVESFWLVLVKSNKVNAVCITVMNDVCFLLAASLHWSSDCYDPLLKTSLHPESFEVLDESERDNP